MKNTNFKTKLIARIMLLVLLLASAVSLGACGYKTDVDIEKCFNIDDGTIKFLCMRSIFNVFPSYTKNTPYWGTGYIDSGLRIVNGQSLNTRPRITYGITISNSDWGDGRTFYEKHIKKYISKQGSHHYSMIISADFYAFVGEIGEIRYEFDEHYSKGERIKIYNNDELVSEVSVITKLKKSEDFYRELLEKTLFVISIDKYSEIKYSDVAVNEDYYYYDPNLDVMEFSYVSLRDVRNSEQVTELIKYDSKFSGGYSSVAHKVGYYDVINEVKLDFSTESLNNNIQIEAEFYEYRAAMGKIEYSFVTDKQKGDCVELYTNNYLIGKIFYNSKSEISNEWLTEFLNENLVVMTVRK